MMRAVSSLSANQKALGDYTYSTLPTASAYTGYLARVTDSGVPCLWVVSDGTRWVPAGPQVLMHSAVPIGIAPTGSMANNGAVTLGTALDVIYTGGIYLYYPASAIVAGSAAGFYWTVMSSTTVGVVKNNTYTSGTPTVPSSPTAFVTTGPGAFTGSVAAFNAYSLTVLGGLLGINGGLRISYTAVGNNNANNKIINTIYGAFTAHAISIASFVNGTQQFMISNRGVANSQIAGTGATGGNFGVSATVPLLGTVDSTADQTLTLNIQHTTATDYIILQDVLFEVLP